MKKVIFSFCVLMAISLVSMCVSAQSKVFKAAAVAQVMFDEYDQEVGYGEWMKCSTTITMDRNLFVLNADKQLIPTTMRYKVQNVEYFEDAEEGSVEYDCIDSNGDEACVSLRVAASNPNEAILVMDYGQETYAFLLKDAGKVVNKKSGAKSKKSSGKRRH